MKFKQEIILIVGAIFGGFLYGAGPQGNSNDLAQLRKSIEALDEAIEKRNLDNFSDTYSDNAYLLPPNGQIIKGKPAIKEFWRRGFPNAEVSFEEIELRRTGNTAYRIFNYTYKFPRKDQTPFIYKGKSLHIWHKQPDGTWKLHIDMWNSSMPRTQ